MILPLVVFLAAVWLAAGYCIAAQAEALDWRSAVWGFAFVATLMLLAGRWAGLALLKSWP